MKDVRKSMVASKWLLIDDIRNIPGVDVTARTYSEGLDCILNKGPWECIMFDHDLGSFDENGREMTGYDLMCVLEKNPHLIPNNILIITQNASAIPKMVELKQKLLGMKYKKNN